MDKYEREALRSFMTGDGLTRMPIGQIQQLYQAVAREIVGRQTACKHPSRVLDEGCGVTADRIVCTDCGHAEVC